MPQKPVIGMIVPPANGPVPPECLRLYADRADFVAEGLGLDRLTAPGYESVIWKAGSLARSLADRGASVVSLMGTSLSFFRGVTFNKELATAMRDASGRPATTMSYAIMDALRALGARRVAVGTAYATDVNRRLAAFLGECGFAVGEVVGLGIEEVQDVAGISSETLLDLGRRTHAADPGADVLLISCGGLQTLDVTGVLEDEIGKPVVSSAVAGAWAAVRLAGLDPTATGFGTMLKHG